MGKTPKSFSHDQLQKITSEFRESLGSGSYGIVYKGKLDNGVEVAVKVLKSSLLTDEQFKTEVKILCDTNHRNVLKLHGVCSEHNVKAIIYEFMKNGSLHDLLSGDKDIAWKTWCNIAIGTAKGLSYLHGDCQPGIIHYDIKPSNILLDSKFIPRVGDFGSAKFLGEDRTHITHTGVRGTRGYVAPEFNMPFTHITHKCDVYSYGITLFDIISGKKHFLDKERVWFPSYVWKKFNERQQEEFMKECRIQKKNREQACRFFSIALRCVQHRPADRPSMSEVVKLLEGKEVLELPNDPQYLPSESSTPKHVPADRPLENCVMIGAKELNFGKARVQENWKWTTDNQSRFSEVAQLVSSKWIKIEGTIDPQRLLSEKTYEVYLVFKSADNACGLDLPAEASVSFFGGGNGASGTRTVYLDPNGKRRQRKPYPLHLMGRLHRLSGHIFREMSSSIAHSLNKSRFPHERQDGWMEVNMGKFNNDDKGNKVKVSLVAKENLSMLKSGLIVEGIELRPMTPRWYYVCTKA